MLLLALFLALPLSLRYLTSWRMKRMQVAVLQQDREVRVLLARYEQLTEELRRVKQSRRQCEVKRSFLTMDIQEGRRQLEELRASGSPSDRRLAA